MNKKFKNNKNIVNILAIIDLSCRGINLIRYDIIHYFPYDC